MRLFRNTQATATADDWTCIYGGHLIPIGEPYISVCYSRERYDGRAVDVDDCGTVFWACMQHAPSEDAVIAALRSAGIPVEG
jgi:hypothetical protein